MPVWLRATIFILLAPGSVAGWLPWYVAGSPRAPWSVAHGWWRAGAVLTLIGWAVLLWCARDFALRGRGTPAPYDAPRSLVTSGLYRYLRNPMYVAVLTAILGQAIWYRSASVALYAVIIALCCHTFVMLYEEPRLTSLFGDAYTEYCRRVPRWLPRSTKQGRR
jgi:protein-S-isoprenylcysteine O-methyltransferase Ste14